MNKTISQNTRLGIFVIAGTLFLIMLLYMIGAKRSLFSSTFRISAEFYNVNGLMEGNNVRFSGINVGIVESVDINTDSTVNVVMLIENKVKPYIKKNAIASVGTDGLMGNKLVNINSVKNGPAIHVENGDILETLKPIETDEMLRTLNTTNDNIKVITGDLKKITQKINNRNSLWSLLLDTVVADNLKQAIVSIKITGDRAATVTGDFKAITKGFKNNNNLVATLFTDSTISGRLENTLVKLNIAGDKIAYISGDLSNLTSKMQNGEGTVGMLVTDSVFANDLRSTLRNLDNGTDGFNQNMEALKHNFLFRGYFKKQAKKAGKKQ
jgi:phospholipid/cholesterol/gamma-HCH transport system substrate-binding protein